MIRLAYFLFLVVLFDGFYKATTKDAVFQENGVLNGKWFLNGKWRMENYFFASQKNIL